MFVLYLIVPVVKKPFETIFQNKNNLPGIWTSYKRKIIPSSKDASKSSQVFRV